MTEGAGNADGFELTAAIHAPDDADYGVQREQRERHRWIAEVELARRQGVADRSGQRLGVDLETDLERRRRRDGGDRTLHLQRVGPQLLVAKRVEAEDRPAVGLFRA